MEPSQSVSQASPVQGRSAEGPLGHTRTPFFHFLPKRKYLHHVTCCVCLTEQQSPPGGERRAEEKEEEEVSGSRARQSHWHDTVTCKDSLHWAAPCTTTGNEPWTCLPSHRPATCTRLGPSHTHHQEAKAALIMYFITGLQMPFGRHKRKIRGWIRCTCTGSFSREAALRLCVHLG